MSFLDFITPSTVLLLAVIFLLAYFLKKSFVNEVLTPEGVVEELQPLVDDEKRFVKHVNSFLRGLKIEGTGSAVGPPLQGVDGVTLTLDGVGETDDFGGDPPFFVMEIIFLKVSAPTEVKRDDLVSFKGFLVGAELLGTIIKLSIEISELTYVGADPDLEYDDDNGSSGAMLLGP
jgi:hypothetical protein